MLNARRPKAFSYARKFPAAVEHWRLTIALVVYGIVRAIGWVIAGLRRDETDHARLAAD